MEKYRRPVVMKEVAKPLRGRVVYGKGVGRTEPDEEELVLKLIAS